MYNHYWDNLSIVWLSKDDINSYIVLAIALIILPLTSPNYRHTITVMIAMITVLP